MLILFIEFSDILNSLLLLLKRLGENLWSDEGVEYPQVVFDAVKDNPAFAALLETHETAGEQNRYLAWFAEYLHTIRKLPAFDEVLAKMVDFLCEEMQHERFKVSRPVTMNTAMRVCPLPVFLSMAGLLCLPAAQQHFAPTSQRGTIYD
jgi:senataxin